MMHKYNKAADYHNSLKPTQKHLFNRIMCLFYRYLYWTDWNLSPYIGRIGMNGDNATRIITKKIGWPNALAIDYETNRLWWGDAHLDFIE